MSRFISLSSTNRSLGIVLQSYSLGDLTAHLAHQLLAAITFLLQYMGYRPIQAVAIRVGKILGRNYDDRHRPPSLVFADFLEKRKPVHYRHHQIEENHAGGLLAQALQCFLPVGSSAHIPSLGAQGPFNHV